MDPITIIRAERTVGTAVCQWNAWDSEGNYWYLRFSDCRGTLSKDYDVERAVKQFYDDSIDLQSGGITIEDMCMSLGIRLDLDAKAPGFAKPPISIGDNLYKAELDLPRPGQVMVVVSNGSRWANLSIDRSHFNLGNFEIIDQVLRELDEAIE